MAAGDDFGVGVLASASLRRAVKLDRLGAGALLAYVGLVLLIYVVDHQGPQIAHKLWFNDALRFASLHGLGLAGAAVLVRRLTALAGQAPAACREATLRRFGPVLAATGLLAVGPCFLLSDPGTGLVLRGAVAHGEHLWVGNLVAKLLSLLGLGYAVVFLAPRLPALVWWCSGRTGSRQASARLVGSEKGRILAAFAGLALLAEALAYAIRFGVGGWVVPGLKVVWAAGLPTVQPGLVYSGLIAPLAAAPGYALVAGFAVELTRRLGALAGPRPLPCAALNLRKIDPDPADLMRVSAVLDCPGPCRSRIVAWGDKARHWPRSSPGHRLRSSIGACSRPVA